MPKHGREMKERMMREVMRRPAKSGGKDQKKKDDKPMRKTRKGGEC